MFIFATHCISDNSCGAKMNREILRDSSGATAVEYGIIVALIAVGTISAFMSLGTNVSNTYSTVDASLADGDAAGNAGGNGDLPDAGSAGADAGSGGASGGGSGGSDGSSGSSSSSSGSSSGSSGNGSGAGSGSAGNGSASNGNSNSDNSNNDRVPIRARDRGVPRPK